MLYCIDSNVEKPIFILDTHFGVDENGTQGVDGSLFSRELMEVDAMGKKSAEVWICSPGGNVMEGYKVFNSILCTKMKVDTFAFGIVASIAAVIFQAGRVRRMADYALLMYHNPYNSDGGNAGKEMDLIRVSLATMITKRSGKPQAEVESVMNQTTWITADEAKEKGFCDEIEASDEQNKKRLVVSDDVSAMWKESRTIFNSILNTNKNISNMDFSKITNKLNLVTGTNEDGILNAINVIENNYTKAKNDLGEMEAKFKKATDDLKKATDDLAKFKKDAEDKDKKAAEEVEAKNAADALAMVTNAAITGKIKNDAPTIAQWTDTAKLVGVEKCKAMLADLPIVAKSPVIEAVANKLEAGQMATTAANMNASIAAKKK